MDQKKILLRTLQIKGTIATLIAASISLIFFSFHEATGIILGGAIGILNFIILIRFVYTIVSPESGGGKGVIIFQYATKLILFLFIFFAIIKWQLLSILAVLSGFTIILIITVYEGLQQMRSS
ncbi:MAG: ATP synthase subunit I [Nitrospirae bacterium]|nr:ATP synthase subunit I [Nitrospirota bacterium]